jgi:hypothetical protein
MGKVTAIEWQSTENYHLLQTIMILIIANFKENSLIILDYRDGDYVAYRERRKMCPEFWWENEKERDHLEDLDIERRILLKIDLKKK